MIASSYAAVVTVIFAIVGKLDKSTHINSVAEIFLSGCPGNIKQVFACFFGYIAKQQYKLFLAQSSLLLQFVNQIFHNSTPFSINFPSILGKAWMIAFLTLHGNWGPFFRPSFPDKQIERYGAAHLLPCVMLKQPYKSIGY